MRRSTGKPGGDLAVPSLPAASSAAMVARKVELGRLAGPGAAPVTSPEVGRGIATSPPHASAADADSVVTEPGDLVLNATTASDLRTMHGLALLAFEEDDWDLARDWWTRASAGGHVRSMVALAVLAEESGDLSTARSWWLQAARAGDPDAMYSMGLLAEVSGDFSAARSWWRCAAQGASSGTHRLPAA